MRLVAILSQMSDAEVGPTDPTSHDELLAMQGTKESDVGTDEWADEPPDSWMLVAIIQDEHSPTDVKDRAFEQLWGAAYSLAFKVAFSMLQDYHLAEDYASQATMRMYRALPLVKNIGANFEGWVTTITKRLCLSHFRYMRNRQEQPVDEVADLVSDHNRAPVFTSPEGSAINNGLREALNVAMGALTVNQRTCLSLLFFNGMTIAEVAAAMELSEARIKSLQPQALRSLARILQDLDPGIAADYLGTLRRKV